MNPTLNLSAKARLVVYVLSGVGSAIIAYLVAKDLIGDAEVVLWGAIVTIVNGLAAVNTSSAKFTDADMVEMVDQLRSAERLAWSVGEQAGRQSGNH